MIPALKSFVSIENWMCCWRFQNPRPLVESSKHIKRRRTVPYLLRRSSDGYLCSAEAIGEIAMTIDHVSHERRVTRTVRYRFVRPQLDIWSINLAEDHTDLTGQARADFEREARISQLGFLLCSPAATPLWRRVCAAQERFEIRARSDDQRLMMELALAESMR